MTPPSPAARNAAAAKPGQIRPARQAGSWYPADPAELRRDIDADLGEAPSKDTKRVVALVGPHAGLHFSGAVAGAGYARLRGQAIRRIFLLGPSHNVGFEGAALPSPDITGWATPLGNLQLDTQAVAALRGKPGFSGPARAILPEHSLEMHGIFIAAVQPKALLVPIVVGQLDSRQEVEQIAAGLQSLLTEGDVVIASSDFTHYGANYNYVPFRDHVAKNIEAYADEAATAIAKINLASFEQHLDKTGDSICGQAPIRVLLALLPPDAEGARIAFDTSGRQTNDETTSVTYQSIVFTRAAGWPAVKDSAKTAANEKVTRVLDKKGEAVALKMARQTLELYLSRNEVPDSAALGVPGDTVWQQTLGVFVTLKRDGNLRGCIGHIEAVEPLWQDIRDNAISAAVHDPRFPQVTAGELELLDLEISVLTPLKEVSGPEGFVVGRHGVVLSVMGRRAVFLPQVAPEQHWDRETTLAHLSMKAGLEPDAWRDKSARFEVFEAQVFGEREEN